MKTIRRSLKLFTLLIVVALLGGGCAPSTQPKNEIVREPKRWASGSGFHHVPTANRTSVPTKPGSGAAAASTQETSPKVFDQMPLACESNRNFNSRIAPNWVFVLRAPESGVTAFNGCLRFWHSDRSYEQIQANTSLPTQQSSSLSTSHSQKRVIDMDSQLKAEEDVAFALRKELSETIQKTETSCANAGLNISSGSGLRKFLSTSPDHFQFSDINGLADEMESLRRQLPNYFDTLIRKPITTPTPPENPGFPNSADPFAEYQNKLSEATSKISRSLFPKWSNSSGTPPDFSFADTVECANSIAKAAENAQTISNYPPTMRNYILVPCRLLDLNGYVTTTQSISITNGYRMNLDGKSFIECQLNVYAALENAISGLGTQAKKTSSFTGAISTRMVFSDVAMLFTGAFTVPTQANEYENPLMFYQPQSEYNATVMRSLGLFAAHDSLRAVVPLSTSTDVGVGLGIQANTTMTSEFGVYKSADHPLYTAHPFSGDVDSDNFLFVHSSQPLSTSNSKKEVFPAGERLWRRSSDNAREYDPRNTFMMQKKMNQRVLLDIDDARLLVGYSPLSLEPLVGSFEIVIFDPGGGATDGGT